MRRPGCDTLHGPHLVHEPIDAEEFYRLLDGVLIDDTKLFNDKLTEWENFCNYHRPHGGLGGQTPYERLRQKTQTQFNDLRQLHISHISDNVARCGTEAISWPPLSS